MILFCDFNPKIVREYKLNNETENIIESSKIYPSGKGIYMSLFAKKLGIDIRKGVYMYFTGPSYETAAEVRMARILGADAVGMSTVPEAIVARHRGLKILGISTITNMSTGILDTPLDHAEVVEVGKIVAGKFKELLNEIIEEIWWIF